LLLLQATLDEEIDERDWGMQQVLTSANWGGVVGNFFTGGLNLQVRPLFHFHHVLSGVALPMRQLHVNYVSAHTLAVLHSCRAELGDS
jgi:hypothetical protein